MMEPEFDSNLNTLFNQMWEEMPAIFKFTPVKAVLWVMTIVTLFATSAVFYMVASMRNGEVLAEDPAALARDPGAFLESDSIVSNYFLMFGAAIIFLMGLFMLGVIIMARNKEREIYARANILAVSLDQRTKEKRFAEYLETYDEYENLKKEELGQMNAKVVFCPECGFVIPPGADMCPTCGYFSITPDSPESDPSEPES
ncbi:MAG: hypothetical protein II038_10335 [Lachnospiraceae bacterium]|nr:hypothetical protein [Lachnospiraceae bacterium]